MKLMILGAQLFTLLKADIRQDINSRYKNPKIKNGFEYSGTQHKLQNYTLITKL